MERGKAQLIDQEVQGWRKVPSGRGAFVKTLEVWCVWRRHTDKVGGVLMSTHRERLVGTKTGS